MRIVAGKYRRRLLLTNPGITTRPITDRAKVILFDRLQPYLNDHPRVADIFAGTGTMGLEALSRGATSCVFYEYDRKAHELLVQNVKTLGADAESICWRTDVFRTSFRPHSTFACLPYNLVFFDPPYKMTPDIRPGSLLYFALQRLGRPTITADNALLILRCDEHAEFEMPPCWRLDEDHHVNSMHIYFYRRIPADNPEAVDQAEAVDQEHVEPRVEAADPVSTELDAEPGTDEFAFIP